jgi:hypothetical protein
MFEGSEKVGEIQRLVGHSSQEEQKMVATVEQIVHRDTKSEMEFGQKR